MALQAKTPGTHYGKYSLRKSPHRLLYITPFACMGRNKQTGNIPQGKQPRIKA
jgi:hypothetical protein